jgi:hypothetical protein
MHSVDITNHYFLLDKGNREISVVYKSSNIGLPNILFVSSLSQQTSLLSSDLNYAQA